MNKKTFVFAFFCLFSLSVFSQTKGIIVDKVTHQPISYVSIYSKNGEKVSGTTTDDKGHFEINFPFHSLVFSHINYLKIEIDRKSKIDTIYLSPKDILLNELTVTNRKPKWINRVLTEVVKQKYKNYQNSEKQLSYNYETYTLSDSSGYAFRSKGFLLVPVFSKNENYFIHAANNTIRYKDKTAKSDFSNLKRMLYDDFIKKFDVGFVNNYIFMENSSFENKDINKVQLMFKSKQNKDDKGYIVVDTLNKVILEFERKSGTEYNIKTRTSFLIRNALATFTGFRYNDWITQIHSKYSKIGNGYQLTESKYKLYMKTSWKNKKTDAKYFYSIESQLELAKKSESNEKINWCLIPKPYYMVAVLTKQMQKDEIELNKIPVQFEDF